MSPVSRREMLTLLGGTALAGSAPVAAATRTDDRQRANTVRAFVGSYHWGFFLLDESGTERDHLTLSQGDELRLTAFNVEADGAIAELPGPVRAGIPGPDERARRNRRSIPVQQGVNLEDLHEAAEATYPDHSLAIVDDDFLVRTPDGWRMPGGHGPWDGHHGPGHRGGDRGPYGPGPHGPWRGGEFTGMLAPPTRLWHHATVPTDIGFTVETSGSFGFACTVYCGYGHPYMTDRGRVVVEQG
ncbi:hypothetical protein [Haloarchaeobius sp. HRN-SO-5]|uniref:hypothetical protein n=1 Tax=Haloarchaeobius sp. HRN-SO-5 TaxID=3446118 RepID=UPI003EBEADE8